MTSALSSRRLGRGAALSLTLALGACAALGPNFTPPRTKSPETYVAKGEAPPVETRLVADERPGGPWWKALGSADLDAVMSQALKDSPDLAQADATLGEVRDLAAAAHGGLYPQVGVNAGAERTRINTTVFGFPGFPSPTFNYYTIGGTVSYDLDIFGGERRSVEAARARAEAQARRGDAAYLTLTGQVAMAAVQIAGLQARLAALGQIAKDDRETIDMMSRAESAGGDPPSASNGVKTRLAEDLAYAPPLEQALAEERHALALLVGESPADWTPPDFTVASFSPPSTLAISVPSTLLKRRPDVRAAEADLHVQTALVGVATANLYPDLRLAAGLTQEGITPRALFNTTAAAYDFGAQLTAPIFDGGALRARRRAAQDDARAALAAYHKTVLAAFNQVADALTAVAHDDDEAKADERTLELAKANLTDARNAYGLGGGPMSDLLIAQSQLDHARLTLVEAQGQRLADIITLLAATAGDWRDPPSDLAAGNPNVH